MRQEDIDCLLMINHAQAEKREREQKQQQQKSKINRR